MYYSNLNWIERAGQVSFPESLQVPVLKFTVTSGGCGGGMNWEIETDSPRE